ncbi:PepSY domain-containing protein [Roseibacterium sp. SDUM158017]|uniref:PepSY domain-containing protein n=1 Tax=Roseicyclus salinarum TaxID=3036773 RepID=UPI00241590FA|nr:PepSY domain-containing protein [Roseibacterium sp. SDUM158017]MDG4647918.1 PepSY domain-containing protein [Roseibacterium sp. SDUM158017]
MTKTFLSTTACCFLLATAAVAQTDDTMMEDEVTQEEMTAADEAADVMFVEIYGDAAPAYMTTTEAIDRMMAMGYTNVHDLDVEWGRYEVEAYAPDGNEVEIEFDPVTGAILDISDNWF